MAVPLKVQVLLLMPWRQTLGRDEWTKPPRGHRKLNVDASYYPDRSESAGIVLRNNKGEVIAGKACLLNNMMSVLIVEAMALLRGLELIQACNGDTEVLSPYTVVLADCFQIASTMDLVIFEHYFRDANTVAHNLAKHTYKSKVSLVWDDSPLFHYR
jgi:hypothetical protein